jgi:hypothetical protein
MANIRFRVHQVPHYSEILENEWYNRSQHFDNTPDTFFTLMTMMNVLEPILDPIQIAIRNSENDLQLRRNDNIEINVNSQLYSTTSKKYDTCCICTDNYKNNDNVSVLDCGHIYHATCIKEWGKYKSSCPVCNIQILNNYSIIDEID